MHILLMLGMITSVIFFRSDSRLLSFAYKHEACPFANQFFYMRLKSDMFIYINVLLLQHAYRDGRLEEVVLRHLGAEDGHTVIAKNIRFFTICSSIIEFLCFIS